MAAVRLLTWVAAGIVIVAPLIGPGGLLALDGVAVADPSLSIRGSISDLVPGEPATLRLSLRNPGAVPAVVHEVRARVASSTAGCAVDALQITPWRGEVRVPGHADATVSLRVRLDASAPGCATAVWRLHYTAF